MWRTHSCVQRRRVYTGHILYTGYRGHREQRGGYACGNALERTRCDGREIRIHRGLAEPGLDDGRIVPVLWSDARHRLQVGGAVRGGRTGWIASFVASAATPSERGFGRDRGHSDRVTSETSKLASSEDPRADRAGSCAVRAAGGLACPEPANKQPHRSEERRVG